MDFKLFGTEFLLCWTILCNYYVYFCSVFCFYIRHIFRTYLYSSIYKEMVSCVFEQGFELAPLSDTGSGASCLSHCPRLSTTWSSSAAAGLKTIFRRSSSENYSHESIQSGLSTEEYPSIQKHRSNFNQPNSLDQKTSAKPKSSYMKPYAKIIHPKPQNH